MKGALPLFFSLTSKIAKMNFTFTKKERLCSKILIDSVFQNGSKIYAYPLKAIFLPVEPIGPSAVQILISVSKLRFKRANKRNLIKRRIREAYRKNNFRIRSIIASSGKFLNLVIIYNSNEIIAYRVMEKALIEILDKISKQPVFQSDLKKA